MTKIIRIDNLDPKNMYGSAEALDKNYLDQLQDTGVDIAIYSYHNAGYEGGGDLVCSKDGKWYHFNLGHCSCNGPLDDLSFDIKKGHGSLVELLEVFSEEARSSIYVLLSTYEATLSDEPDEEIKS